MYRSGGKLAKPIRQIKGLAGGSAVQKCPENRKISRAGTQKAGETAG
jgi:hypothetical protein